MDVDPVEMLVELAKRGEIDPWNIDIVQVTDAFLRQIEHMRTMNLALPARTLFYASVLLRMKSEALTEEHAEEPPPMEEPEEQMALLENYPELHIPTRRRTKRPATLDELIEELKKAERVERRRKERREVRAERSEVVDVSHEENMEDTVRMVWESLRGLLSSKRRLTLSELLCTLTDVPAVFIYLSLLFLANERRIRLHQDEFFGELYIEGR
ncbi:segregation and condensation protein A [Methermicoccus shengliensis]|uniref:Segregation/condensation protein A n=1 Tax=Methermicoccus shengliensis TaxID=660064 RepID=A0A832VX70_9EURY|nr:ScpA family protein [Methermicoccus shengliensis]KUK04748.1 MAG: Chromosome segregation and condensation protein ScpA [Euryarchaeota archaeon 55_53]KUK29830.1 MAG: Chromosome segregation and condensation protein ScpA [Methanosarcinales archeaon 56_1174]MDI3487392.1 segregation and condensation protein [Methanosarcinales archaeon]MDN5295279.1 segregation and condensation protein [Methanosarcinales archaeon]HIH69632.1 segregation/condensation protein A [Methermicoccus shengliensis]